jgi:hypothetical protein
MSELFSKLKKSLLELEEENGKVILFALFLRADALDKWDLLVSASWLDSTSLKAYDLVADAIQRQLEDSEIVKLDRFVILDSSDPIVHFLQNAYPVPNGSIKNVTDCAPLTDRFGFTIKQASVLRCIEG